MIITIDGPSGVGKSTVTKELAARLGFEYLNTGSMYRAVALAMLRAGIACTDERGVEAALPGVRLRVPPGRVLLSGEDVSALVRTDAVTRGASEVSKHRAVRLTLTAAQRAAAHGRDIVCDGRDQGSFVFKAADAKFFLTADPRVRAERRAAELRLKGERPSVAAVLAEQAERDRRDAERDLAPMKPAPDAVVLDTTYLSARGVVERLENVVRGLLACRPA